MVSQELTEEPASATTEPDEPTTSDAVDAKDGNNENEPLLQQLAGELTNRLRQQNDVTKRARERAEEEAMRVKVGSLPPSPLEQVTSWLVAPLTPAGVVIVLTLFMRIQREDLPDRVQLPALMLAERDRHRGNRAEDRRAFIMCVFWSRGGM